LGLWHVAVKQFKYGYVCCVITLIDINFKAKSLGIVQFLGKVCPFFSKIFNSNGLDPMRAEDDTPREDIKNDPELGEHQANHGIEGIESSVSDSSFDSDEEPGDEFDLDYDPCRDC